MKNNRWFGSLLIFSLFTSSTLFAGFGDNEKSPVNAGPFNPNDPANFPGELTQIITGKLSPADAGHFSEACATIQFVTKDILEIKRREAVAKNVERYLNAMSEAANQKELDEYVKQEKELKSYINRLPTPLLAVAFQQTDKEVKGHVMRDLQVKMVKKAFNDRDFGMLKYLLSIGADPRRLGLGDNIEYNGMTKDDVGVHSWAIENGHNDILEAILNGLKRRDSDGYYGVKLLSENRMQVNPIAFAIEYNNVDAAKLLINHLPGEMLVDWMRVGRRSGDYLDWAKKEKLSELVELFSSPSMVTKLEQYVSILEKENHEWNRQDIEATKTFIQKIKEIQAERASDNSQNGEGK